MPSQVDGTRRDRPLAALRVPLHHNLAPAGENLQVLFCGNPGIGVLGRTKVQRLLTVSHLRDLGDFPQRQ